MKVSLSPKSHIIERERAWHMLGNPTKLAMTGLILNRVPLLELSVAILFAPHAVVSMSCFFVSGHCAGPGSSQSAFTILIV